MRTRREQLRAIRDRMQPSFDRRPKPPYIPKALTWESLQTVYAHAQATSNWADEHNALLEEVIAEEIKK